MPGPRALAKRLAERFTGSRAGAIALSWYGRGKGVALGYHNVIPDDEPVTGDPSIHLKRSDFAAQVDEVARRCEVVSLESLLSPGRDPDPGGPLRVSFTFDDAYAGAIRVGLPLLMERGFPATVFVASGLMGGRAFWWDDLDLSPWDGARVPLRTLRGDEAKIREWAREQRIPPRPQGPHQLSATWEELSDVVDTSRGLITLGLHTVTHPNLAELDDEAVRREVDGCRRDLEERGLLALPHLAYPFGLENPRLGEVLGTLGIEAAWRITGGALPASGVARFSLPRAVVPAGVSRHGFVLRLFGVVPG